MLNVCVSDVYHNSDYLFGSSKQFTFREESLCLRADFTVNALIIASLHAYWLLVHYITFADAIDAAWLKECSARVKQSHISASSMRRMVTCDDLCNIMY